MDHKPLTDASGTSDPSRYFTDNCRCECGCQFFCRPIDKGVCDYCRTDHHPTKAHFFDPEEEYECTFCEMPQELETTVPRCPRISPSKLQLLSA